MGQFSFPSVRRRTRLGKIKGEKKMRFFISVMKAMARQQLGSGKGLAEEASISPSLTRGLRYAPACLRMPCQQHPIFWNEGRVRLTAVPSMEAAKQRQPLPPVWWHQAKGRHQWRARIPNSWHASEHVRETEDRAFRSTIIGSTVCFFSNHRISKKGLVEVDPGKEHITVRGIRRISEKK